jgi:hypothetical protein
VFSNHFDGLMLKIILKKYYFDISEKKTTVTIVLNTVKDSLIFPVVFADQIARLINININYGLLYPNKKVQFKR